MSLLPLWLFVCVCIVLLTGYPIAFALSGSALLFALISYLFGAFDLSILYAFPSRIFGIMTNQILMAVPLFVFMGVMLEKSKVAEALLSNLAKIFRKHPSGLGLSVVIVGMLLAASTGIVGATVVTMGLISLPIMLQRQYPTTFAAGLITATGSLGQIIPPSIALVLLGDVLSSAYQKAQLDQGIFSPDTLSVGDLFAGAIGPGLCLVFCYAIYTIFRLRKLPIVNADIDIKIGQKQPLWLSLLSPLLLMILVLGSILFGFATPTEAAGIGAFGATILAILSKNLTLVFVKEILLSVVKITTMIFLILIGASLFSLVFRGLGGDDLVAHWFSQLPGGTMSALLIVMLLIFLLGFILDFIEITFVVIPIVAPFLLQQGVDPVWFGILVAVNLQTSFLTPPFGFALFYLRGVAPPSITTVEIYKGALPFVAIQLLVLILIFVWPSLATWLPGKLYS